MPLIKQSKDINEVIGASDSAEVAESLKDVAFKETTTGDVFKAAFAQENSLGSLIANRTTLSNKAMPVNGYDPLEKDKQDIKGYELFSKEFMFSQSPTETQQIKDKIDGEFKNRQTLQAAGVKGFVAQMAAGVTDPIYLPFMATGIGLWGRSGSTLAQVGKTAVISGVSEIVSEGAKHATQKTRTFEESLINVSGATMLAGVLGGAAKGIGKIKYDRMAKKYADNLLDETDKMLAVNQSQSISEAIVKGESILDLVSAGKIENWGVSPLVRTQTSAVEITKQLASDMMETPLISKGNIDGIATAPIGGSVETLIKKHQAKIADSFSEMEDLYSGYRGAGRAKQALQDGILRNRAEKLSWNEFKEEIGKTLRRRDESAIPEVRAAAESYRKKVLDPLKDEAIELGLLPKDVDVTTAASYLTRVYKHNKIRAQRDSWDGIVGDWLKSERLTAKEDLPALLKKASDVVGEDITLPGSTRESLDLAQSELASKVGRIESELSKKISDVDELRVDIKKQTASTEKLKNSLKVADASESELKKELGSTIERFMKFRPDVDSEKFSKQMVAENKKINKINSDIKSLQKAEVELHKEATNQLAAFLSSRTKKAGQKNKAHSATFQRIERQLLEIRKNISLKQGDRDNLVTGLGEIASKTKNVKAGSKAKAKELSVAISRLQKKIKPRREKADILTQSVKDIIGEVKASRLKLSEKIDERLGIEGGLRTTRALSKQVTRQFEKNKVAFIKDTEIQDIVNEITDNILGNNAGRSNYGIVALKRGPLKERVFNIPDYAIEDFLESDIDLVSRQYVRTMAPDIELTRRFGRTDMSDQIAQINTDWTNKINEAKTEKQRLKFDKKRESDIEDIKAMRDRLMGTYRAPEDPNKFFVRAGRTLRTVNFMRMLGSMTLSAIPDMARPIAVNGLKPVVKGLKALALSPKTFNIAREQGKKWAVGLDMVLNSRASTMADVADIYGKGTSFERGLTKTSDTFSKMTLMTQWNAGMKQFSGVVTADRLLTESLNSASGVIKKNALRRMAQAGIGNDMAVRIAKEFEKHGDDGTIKLSNAHQWTDKEAYDTFTSAVLKDVDRTIVTPGAGESPLWTSSEMGKLIFQFKSFAGAAHHKILLADLQHRDASALNGFLMSVALGTMTYGIKNWVAGREINTDPKKMIIESLDRSGAFGYFWDINNTLEKATRGTVGVNPLIGGDPMSRYVSRNITGALLGPSFGTMQDISQITGAVSSGEFTKKDLRKVRKMLPGQNLFYMRQLLNKLEDKAGRGLKK